MHDVLEGEQRGKQHPAPLNGTNMPELSASQGTGLAIGPKGWLVEGGSRVC
jgi:hypothetical protein